MSSGFSFSSLSLILIAGSFYIKVIKMTAALDLPECSVSVPLGMESGDIPDSSLSASSSYETESVGPKSARIRQEVNGGAWCPKPRITTDSYEYLQVELNELSTITAVEVQGRFGNGQGQEFATAFRLEYQTDNTSKWLKFRNSGGREVLRGNTNTYLAEIRYLNPPIIARKIRFIPHAIEPETVCMRVEVYGCKYKEMATTEMATTTNYNQVPLELQTIRTSTVEVKGRVIIPLKGSSGSAIRY